MDRRIFGRRVIVGYNNEPALLFGIHREPLFTAIGLWPILVGIGRKRGCRCGHTH